MIIDISLDIGRMKFEEALQRPQNTAIQSSTMSEGMQGANISTMPSQPPQDWARGPSPEKKIGQKQLPIPRLNGRSKSIKVRLGGHSPIYVVQSFRGLPRGAQRFLTNLGSGPDHTHDWRMKMLDSLLNKLLTR